MTLRGQSIALTPRELDVLDALRVDRDECGPGLARADVERVGVTRWPESLVRRLVGAGYTVGEYGGRYELGHGEPASIETADARRPATVKGRGPAPAGTVGQASAVSVDAAPRLFDVDGGMMPRSHHGSYARAFSDAA